MKNIIILLLLSSSLFTYAQEDKFLEIEDVEVIEENDGPMEVPFSVVENIPVYKGCDESLAKTDLKKCMSDAISNHVAKKFNTKMATELGLAEGKIRINTIFKIDTKGNIIDVQARASHPKLKAEAIRVIKLIPTMEKPGYQRGEAVIVPYSLPIIFNVDSKKDSKK